MSLGGWKYRDGPPCVGTRGLVNGGRGNVVARRSGQPLAAQSSTLARSSRLPAAPGARVRFNLVDGEKEGYSNSRHR